MNGTLADCARAALTHEAVKRVQEKRRVSWFENGYKYTATPRDDKYAGAWLVSGNGWETYTPVHCLEAVLRGAEGFPFEQPE